MRPIVYITAAILAIVAGYLAVYVNLSPKGKDNAVVAEKPSEQKSQPVVKTEKTEKIKQQKASISSPNIIKKNALSGLNIGHMTTFVVRPKPIDLPEFEFFDAEGSKQSLKTWSGKVVLLNLWATWCAPCREEMPAFDELKAMLGGDKFDVVTISIDRGGIKKPQKFFKDTKVKNLVLYHDRSARLAAKLRAFGMPTTILINANGKEIGRLVGPAEWASQDAIALMKAAISQNN